MIRRLRAAWRMFTGPNLPDDLAAIVEATRETYPTITRRPWDDDPTPLGDAAHLHALAERCRIEHAMADWASEVAACADAELADMTNQGDQ